MPSSTSESIIKSPVAKLLSAELKELSRRLGSGSRLPSTRELCRNYRTSLATVSTVLNELESQHIIVRRHGQGVFVAPTVNQRSIAVLLTSTFFAATDVSPFWPLVWANLTKALTERSRLQSERYVYHLMTPKEETNEYDIESLAQVVTRNDVQFILSIGIHGNCQGKIDQILRSGKPPVISFAGPGVRTIDMDVLDIIHRAVPTLHSEGCKRIELWRILPRNGVHEYVWQDMSKIFESCAAKNGYAFGEYKVRDLRKEITELHLSPVPSPIDQGYILANKAFSGSDEAPDGLIIMDDLATSGALAAISSLGLKPKTDVKIATLSIEGSHILYGYEQDLIRFSYDPEALIKTLLEQLDNQISRTQLGLPEHAFIRPTLEIYSSRSAPILNNDSRLLL